MQVRCLLFRILSRFCDIMLCVPLTTWQKRQMIAYLITFLLLRVYHCLCSSTCLFLLVAWVCLRLWYFLVVFISCFGNNNQHRIRSKYPPPPPKKKQKKKKKKKKTNKQTKNKTKKPQNPTTTTTTTTTKKQKTDGKL